MLEKLVSSMVHVEEHEPGPREMGDFNFYTKIEEEGVWGFREPFRLSWFLTITGSEYFHVYLWIAKDISWTQEIRYLSLVFGTFATLWCIIIFYHAFRSGNRDEVYNTVALFLWIFANYWWMTGEVYSDFYPDEPSIDLKRTNESGWILAVALLWLTIYYSLIVPFKLMPLGPDSAAAYDDGQYKSRFAYMSFRQYENLHMFFWLAKDLCWNRENIPLWFIMVGPAILLAADFMFISAFCKNSVVDTVHYATIFLWVLGNSTWALGEFFDDKDDAPIRLWHLSAESLRTARWYSSWILLLSFLPIFMLYSVWIPLTLSGQLDHLAVDQNMKVEIGKDRWGLTAYQEDEDKGGAIEGCSARARAVSEASSSRVRDGNALTYRGKSQASFHFPPSYAADNDLKREKGERNQSKGTRIKRKGDVESTEQSITFNENEEDLLNNSDYDFDDSNSCENSMQDTEVENDDIILSQIKTPLNDESHHSIVSSTFV